MKLKNVRFFFSLVAVAGVADTKMEKVNAGAPQKAGTAPQHCL